MTAEGGPAPAASVRRSFLFTDLEGSTRMWEEDPAAMETALARHDVILRAAVESHGGQVVKTLGDGFHVAFASVHDAIDAAVAGQLALAGESWGTTEPLVVRMGIHSGPAARRDDDYFGATVNRAARLMSAAHGGQILLSGGGHAEVQHEMLENVDFLDLGMHRLRDIAEPIRVYTVFADGLPDRFDDLRPTARPISPLPRSLTTFVGRTAEMERIRSQLSDHRLVTITGLAGVGKTRLALEVAEVVAEGFSDGSAFCEFAGGEPAQVGAVLGKALGVERRTLRSAEESVVEWLYDKDMLIVLDNCEDATESVGELASAVLRFAPGCQMLATSREPLAVPGEHVTVLQPFDTAADDASVLLFLERARAAGAELVDDDADTQMLAREVCAAVAGVPLAIELAASNAASLSLGDIVDAIRAGELPTSGRAGGRHRSVDDALDLTFDRLEAGLRDAFLRCSVLTGSFDRDAFTAVAAPPVDDVPVLGLLRGLVDRSLVVSETRLERTRFRLLDPVRAYAEARLDPPAREAARAAFVDHYVATAEAAADRLRGPDEARFVSQLELDFDNLRLAHSRAIAAGEVDAALRIVAALWDFAFMRMRSEIFDWGEAAAAAATPDHHGQALVLGVVALGGWLRESPAKARQFAAESLRLEAEHGEPQSLPVRLALLNAAEYGGDTTDVRRVMAEVIALSNESENPYWQTNADVVRSLGHSFAGRTAPAMELANRALTRARDSENPSTIAWALFGRAVATEALDVEHAEALLDDCLGRARSVQNRWVEAMCSTRLASLRRRHGSVADAMTMVLELLDTWERAGHRSHVWSAVRQAALCLADAGDSATAVMLNEAATTARLELPQLPADAEDLITVLDTIRADVGEEQMRRWAARADGLDQPEAVRIARERLELAISS